MFLLFTVLIHAHGQQRNIEKPERRLCTFLEHIYDLLPNYKVSYLAEQK